MTMQMQRAFNSRMQAPMTLYTVIAGSYDENNNWVKGGRTATSVMGVITAGNKFSQFDEGIALHAEDGGSRYSNYRNLYIKDTYKVSRGDKVGFRGAYYNVLQESDEAIFGFSSYILEKSEDEQP